MRKILWCGPGTERLSVCVSCRRVRLKAVNTPTSSTLCLTCRGATRAHCHPAPRCQPAQSESDTPAHIHTPSHAHIHTRSHTHSMSRRHKYTHVATPVQHSYSQSEPLYCCGHTCAHTHTHLYSIVHSSHPALQWQPAQSESHIQL